MHTESESLGEIEIKHITLGDTTYIAKLLQSELSDKDFTLKILFHQLLEPTISLDKFQSLPDQEIEKIGRCFVKEEDSFSEYFQDSGDFFKDFKLSIKVGYENHIEKMRKTFEPIIRSTQEILRAFSDNYSSVIQQTLDGASYIKESLQGLARAAKQITDTHRQLHESIKPMVEQYQSAAKIIAESLRPQIDFWQKWTEQNKQIFDSLSNYWEDFQKKYNISEKKAVAILQKYKWFIAPSLPITFVFEVVELDKKQGRQDSAVNRLFVNFFEAHNWKNLETMVGDWKKKPLLKKRYKILADCVEIIKIASKKGINEANVVLPALITQIDGALTNYLNSKGISWDCDYNDWVDSRTGKVKGISRPTQLKKVKPRVLTTQLDDLANDIFLNILFQRSQRGKPLATPFNFNRHKIIHGENVKYGRKDYLIRAFMVLDLLVHY